MPFSGERKSERSDRCVRPPATVSYASSPGRMDAHQHQVVPGWRIRREPNGPQVVVREAIAPRTKNVHGDPVRHGIESVRGSVKPKNRPWLCVVSGASGEKIDLTLGGDLRQERTDVLAYVFHHAHDQVSVGPEPSLDGHLDKHVRTFAHGRTTIPAFSGGRERERSDRPVRPLQRRVGRPTSRDGVNQELREMLEWESRFRGTGVFVVAKRVTRVFTREQPANSRV